MLNVVEMPIDRLSDHELQMREWEAVMAAGYGSTEHRQVKSEIQRRMSAHDSVRPASVH
ncbi:MAG: hypothetical protein ABI843_17010 [Dokdonella sp.]